MSASFVASNESALPEILASFVTFQSANLVSAKSCEIAPLFHNAGGSVGAWVSDMLLYLFGFSAWWWVVLAFYSMWLVYLQLERTISERPFLVFNLVGFALLQLASSTIEAGHLIALPATLPLGAGGMLGNAVDSGLRGMFGYAGSTMLLLLLFAVGFSLFTGWSWIMMTEKLGSGLISAYQWARNKYYDWHDRKAGKVVEHYYRHWIKIQLLGFH